MSPEALARGVRGARRGRGGRAEGSRSEHDRPPRRPGSPEGDLLRRRRRARGRAASAWAARFARSRDWCASQARRYKSVAELKDKGDAAFRAGDARAAERWYAAALDEDPEHPALHYNAAACLEKLGRPLDAARCCASALRCRPDYAAARLRRARCLARGAAADGDRGANAKAYLEAALDEYARCPDAAAEQARVPPLAFCNTADPEADAAAARAYAARAARATSAAAASEAESRGPDACTTSPARRATRLHQRSGARVPRAGAAHAPGQEQGARRRGPLPGAPGGLRRAVGRARAGGVRPGRRLVLCKRFSVF